MNEKENAKAAGVPQNVKTTGHRRLVSSMSDPDIRVDRFSSSARFLNEKSAVNAGTTLEENANEQGAMNMKIVNTSPSQSRLVDPGRDVYTARLSTNTVRPHHIARVFANSTQITEVNQEQINRVKMMHARFSEGIHFSFNYNTLLLVASVIAGLGLVSNSSATIIASMLVSPIMGPVVGLAYGSTIYDFKMVKKAMKVELASLVFCIVVGAVIGAICGVTELHKQWPTAEMESRGQLDTVLVGLPIAFFSGLGVAVGLLDEQTNSLVGVAISASLLPPAVNAGILWVAYVFVERDIIPPPNYVPLAPFNTAASTTTTTMEVDDPSYDRSEYRQMGMYSLCLTLANILLIWLSSMLMFRLKEVLPIKKKVFWNDLAVARKIYQKRAILQTESIDLGLTVNETGEVPGAE